MKLVAGLGNPGRAYDGTRHNVGFDVLEVLARRAGSPGRRTRFQGEFAQTTIRGVPVLLLWPLTWMNLSGASVLAAKDFYKIDTGIFARCGMEKGFSNAFVGIGYAEVFSDHGHLCAIFRGNHPAD